MRLTIESTTKIVEIDGLAAGPRLLPVRIWEGQTESGIPVFCFVVRVAVHREADREQFEHELLEQRPPRNADIDAIPNRLVL